MGNVRKTIDFLKRNGLLNTYYAVMEHLDNRQGVPYSYAPISSEEASKQSEQSRNQGTYFSIVVPVYETPKDYLEAMIDSCLKQTYPHFELILADASVTDNCSKVINNIADERIKYLRIEDNKGISENTNRAIEVAQGEYTVFLDHDDLLTSDALYEINAVLAGLKIKDEYPLLIYSDEDKCNGDASAYFEPNIKPDFNFDLLMSNNYICHLSTVRTSIAKELMLRNEYDGAQDYDFVLRVCRKAVLRVGFSDKLNELIRHIPKVLYHWRCHELSTAANPASKDYAYEAGRKALENFTGCTAEHLMHRGFYRVDWGEDFFAARPEVAAVGGFAYYKGCIARGAYDENRKIMYEGLNRHYSGNMNRAVLTQNVYALDIRNMHINPKLNDLYEEFISKLTAEGAIEEKSDEEILKASIEWGSIVKQRNMLLLLDPLFAARKENKRLRRRHLFSPERTRIKTKVAKRRMTRSGRFL